MLELIREESDDKCKDEGTCPRWNAVQLGADLRVAVGFDDAGGEESVTIGGDDESEIHESAEEEFVIFEAVEDVFGADAALASGATLVLFEPGFDVGAFVFFEPEYSGVDITLPCGWEGPGPPRVGERGLLLLTTSPLPESLVS